MNKLLDHTLRTHFFITNLILPSLLIFKHPYPLHPCSLTDPLLFYLIPVVPTAQLSLLIIIALLIPHIFFFHSCIPASSIPSLLLTYSTCSPLLIFSSSL